MPALPCLVFKYTIRHDMIAAEIERILDAVLVQGQLDEPGAKRVLAAAGIAVPLGRVIRSLPELPLALAGLRFPLAAKLVSPDASHKSDVGGVRLQLTTAEQVQAAVVALESAARERGLRVTGFLIEEMASGQEVVIGGMRDARFGPVLMLGLGGVFVEVLRDVVFRICPLERRDAAEMIGELKGSPLLRGARGRAPVSEAALVQAILAVGGEDGLLVRLAHRITELDINPLIVDGERAVACDARMVLRDA